MGIQINGSNDTIQADDGSLSLAGSVSYEDVTNVTSVGLSTFSSGIHMNDSITHLGDTDTKESDSLLLIRLQQKLVVTKEFV